MTESVLHRVAAGDGESVEACIEQYGDLVWSIARRFVTGQIEIEEAVQDIFVALWRNASRFDAQRSSEQAFVTMVARRRLIDRQRRLGRKGPGLSYEDEPDDGDAVDAAELSGEASLAAEAMAAMAPEQRRMVREAVYDGLTYEEIASGTGHSREDVRAQVRAGLEQVRGQLGARGRVSRGGAG